MSDKEDFIKELKTGQFKEAIFEKYFKEHSDKEWNVNAFKMWLSSQSMLGNIAGLLLQDKIIPYYKAKYKIVELQDKEGNLIKYVE